MIKLEALRVFLAVADAGNIADAGERLGRTGSAVSMALRKLEDELGGPLFETDRKTTLTRLGAYLLETARVQVGGHDAAMARVMDFAGARSGRIGIGAVPSVATTLLPRVLPGFLADRPDVEMELFDQDSAGVIAALDAGRIDVGLAGSTGSGAARGEPLFSDRFMVICGSADPLTRLSEPVRWRDLSADRLILNGASESIDRPEYRALSRASRKTVRNVNSLFALAKAGVGVTILPALATLDAPEGVVALDLEDAAPRRVVALLSRGDVTPSPIASAFRDCLLSELPDFARRTPGLVVL